MAATTKSARPSLTTTYTSKGYEKCPTFTVHLDKAKVGFWPSLYVDKQSITARTNRVYDYATEHGCLILLGGLKWCDTPEAAANSLNSAVLKEVRRLESNDNLTPDRYRRLALLNAYLAVVM